VEPSVRVSEVVDLDTPKEPVLSLFPIGGFRANVV